MKAILYGAVPVGPSSRWPRIRARVCNHARCRRTKFLATLRGAGSVTVRRPRNGRESGQPRLAHLGKPNRN
jgi:hypothetical protein